MLWPWLQPYDYGDDDTDDGGGGGGGGDVDACIYWSARSEEPTRSAIVSCWVACHRRDHSNLAVDITMCYREYY